jgi:hypothetical protein
MVANYSRCRGNKRTRLDSTCGFEERDATAQHFTCELMRTPMPK